MLCDKKFTLHPIAPFHHMRFVNGRYWITALQCIGFHARSRCFHLVVVLLWCGYRRNSEGLTAVLIAASHGHCETLRLLLEAGGDANQTDLDGNDALTLARESGCEQCCAIVNLHRGVYQLLTLLVEQQAKEVRFSLCYLCQGGKVFFGRKFCDISSPGRSMSCTECCSSVFVCSFVC